MFHDLDNEFELHNNFVEKKTIAINSELIIKFDILIKGHTQELTTRHNRIKNSITKINELF